MIIKLSNKIFLKLKKLIKWIEFKTEFNLIVYLDKDVTSFGFIIFKKKKLLMKKINLQCINNSLDIKINYHSNYNSLYIEYLFFDIIFNKNLKNYTIFKFNKDVLNIKEYVFNKNLKISLDKNIKLNKIAKYKQIIDLDDYFFIEYINDGYIIYKKLTDHFFDLDYFKKSNLNLLFKEILNIENYLILKFNKFSFLLGDCYTLFDKKLFCFKKFYGQIVFNKLEKYDKFLLIEIPFYNTILYDINSSKIINFKKIDKNAIITNISLLKDYLIIQFSNYKFILYEILTNKYVVFDDSENKLIIFTRIYDYDEIIYFKLKNNDLLLYYKKLNKFLNFELEEYMEKKIKKVKNFGKFLFIEYNNNCIFLEKFTLKIQNINWLINNDKDILSYYNNLGIIIKNVWNYDKHIHILLNNNEYILINNNIFKLIKFYDNSGDFLPIIFIKDLKNLLYIKLKNGNNLFINKNNMNIDISIEKKEYFKLIDYDNIIIIRKENIINSIIYNKNNNFMLVVSGLYKGYYLYDISFEDTKYYLIIKLSRLKLYLWNKSTFKTHYIHLSIYNYTNPLMNFDLNCSFFNYIILYKEEIRKINYIYILSHYDRNIYKIRIRNNIDWTLIYNEYEFFIKFEFNKILYYYPKYSCQHFKLI